MIADLPSTTIPEWLRSAQEPLGRLPLAELLCGSVFYPASGFDGMPVKFLAGNYHSFVYADYGVTSEGIRHQLGTFRGYAPVAVREVTPRQLAPRGWRPLRPEAAEKIEQSPGRLHREYFALWAILERTQNCWPDHGPERFSLLYVRGEGVAAFRSLYLGNGAAPAVVAIIQPGTGFGGNWTNFEDSNQVFARSVRKNPAGVPGLLLYGGRGGPEFYRRPCWRNYKEPVAVLTPRLRLWRRRPTV